MQTLEQERNTSSHLTESIGLVFTNRTATFCSEDRFGVRARGARCKKKKKVHLGERCERKTGDKEG